MRLSFSQISKWAALLAEKGEGDRQESLDLVFLQLCSLSGDTFVGVRCKALDALGSMTSVSEEVLRVSLSKKTLTVDGMPKSLLADAAGAYIKGLADEFYEVRKSTCSSLAMLTILSNQFAADVLNLLTDMLNDDSGVVRLKAVDAISHVMATGCLKVQERHVVTLVGMLVDVNEDIRSAARQVLRILKLPDLGLFISTFNGLLTNIKSFVQDGPDCLSVIFSIGRNHLNFLRSYAKEFLPLIHPSQNGELSLDRPMVMAFLMLIVALILSKKDADAEIQSLLLLFGTSFVGKLSGCLAGIVNNDLLLQFVHRYKHLSQQVISMDHDNEANSESTHSLSQKEEVCSTLCFQESGHGGSEELPIQVGDHMEGRLYPEKTIIVVKCLLARVGRVWPLIQSRSTIEALRVLRGFIDELEMLRSSNAIDAVLVFALQYVKVLRLLAKLWGKLTPEMLLSVKMTTWDILLEKLDAALRRIMCTFRGLSMEEESHLGELMLLARVIRLSNPGNFSGLTIRKLLSLLPQVATLPDAKPSGFIGHLKEIFSQENVEDIPCTFPFSKLVKSFSLRTFSLCGRFKHIRAEMNVNNNDSENPLPFIPGLPVGIPFQIKLFNVSNTDKIWLQMVVEGIVQHTFLDLVHCRGSGEVRFYTVNVPLYMTPDVSTFSFNVAIIMECPFEDYVGDYIGIGPKHEIVYLCEAKEIFLARMGVEE
ncbi:protein SIEL isoform X2 [Nymphaea colorata]|uniref:protein SIEL isoform X2 n=1 Tax=Nymphaea colorata TaxID=210225 RepID=UPI00214F2943|nr:protein SIEL isoform X2 [Nymphaea colorata]